MKVKSSVFRFRPLNRGATTLYTSGPLLTLMPTSNTIVRVNIKVSPKSLVLGK